MAQVFVDADRAGVQMDFENMPVEFWNVCPEWLPDQHVSNQNVCRGWILILRGTWGEHLTTFQLRMSESERGTEFVMVRFDGM